MINRWTEEDRANLKRLWESGLSSGIIAQRMGRSRSAIMGKVNTLGLMGRPAPSRAERIDLLADYLAEGRTIADAAHRLGVTKTYAFDLFAEMRRGLGWQAR